MHSGQLEGGPLQRDSGKAPGSAGSGEGRGVLSGDAGDKRTEKIIVRCLKYIHSYQE